MEKNFTIYIKVPGAYIHWILLFIASRSTVGCVTPDQSYQPQSLGGISCELAEASHEMENELRKI